MRRIFVLCTLLLAGVLVVACTPSDAGEGLLEKSGLDTTVTGHVVDDAFDSAKPCTDDIQCGVGRLCVERTCQPKPVRP